MIAPFDRKAAGSRTRLGVVALGLLTGLAAAVAYWSGLSGLSLTEYATGAAEKQPLGPPRLDSDPFVPNADGPRGSEDRGVIRRWDGILFAPQSREYELTLTTSASIKLWVDGHLVLEHPNTESPERTKAVWPMQAGERLFALEAATPTRSPSIQLAWDYGSPYHGTPVPPEAFSPVSIRASAWLARRIVAPVVLVVATLWSAVLVSLAGRGIWRALPIGDFTITRQLNVVLAVCGVIYLGGIWWGWPGGQWAPDELTPWGVISGARERFSGGWFTKYPPGHYYTLTLLYSPALVADALGWIRIESSVVLDVLFLQGRLLTVAMALVTLAGIALIAHRLLGRGHAWPAALCAGMFLPFPFYAKTVNLEIPYLFWFVLSLVFLIAIHEDDSQSAVIGFGITGALSIATKDQAYGLYLLPGLHLAWTLLRRRHAPALVGGAAAGLAVLVLAHNLLFNLEGFRSHIDLITGPASEDYRMFPPTLAGQWDLGKASGGLMLWTLGAAGVPLTIAGLAVSRGHARRWPLWLLLPGISHYASFIAVIGYVYDRFLLPVAIIAAVPAAVGLRWLLDLAPRLRVAAPTATIAVGWLIWRAASLDVLLIRDSRYEVEAWLRAQVQRDQLVGWIDEFGYLPRLRPFRQQELLVTVGDTLAVRPEFIVVNTEFLQRLPADSRPRRWLAWLESGDAPYAEAYRYKTPLGWSGLAFGGRFSDRAEDPLTNVDKANPEIVVFRRKD